MRVFEHATGGHSTPTTAAHSVLKWGADAMRRFVSPGHATARYGMAVFVWGAVLVALALFPLWAPLDAMMVRAIVHAGHEPRLDARIVTVDLHVDDAHVWQGVDSFLSSLRSAVTRHHVVPPRAIVLDVVFHDDHYERGIAPAYLASAIRGIRDLGTPVYAAVDPYKPGSTQYRQNFMDALVPVIYDGALAGSGHTEFFVPGNAGDTTVLWYKVTVPERPGIHVYALPLVATGNLSLPHDGTVSFIVGDSSSYRSSWRDAAQARADPTTLSSEVVVLGSSGGGDTGYGGGLEAVVWALSDRMSVADADHISLLADRAVTIGLSLGLAALGAFLFVVAFRLVRSRRAALVAATISAVTVPLIALASTIALLVAHNTIYAQPTFPTVVIVFTSAICWRAGRDQLRAELMIDKAESSKHLEHRYDVFVSYSRDDENRRWITEHVVKPLRAARHADGRPVDVFVDTEAIKTGTEWYEGILEALWGSRFVVAVFTSRYFERAMCAEEFFTAMRRHLDDPAFTILPISRVGNAVPPQYAGIQYVDVDSDPEFIDRIVLTVCCPPNPPRPIPAETVRGETDPKPSETPNVRTLHG